MDIAALGYVGVCARDVGSWEHYATEVLGLAPAERAGDAAQRYRLDHRAWRLAVHEADHHGLLYVGWEVAGPRQFDEAVVELGAAGVDVVLDDDLAAVREVRRLAAFDAPGGHRFEIVESPAVEGTFVSPLGVRFVTGEQGMGHIVLTVPEADYHDALAFHTDVLGFGVSDRLGFGGIEGALLHCGPRHHSLGVVKGGRRPGCDHVMLECEDPDDVGRCWDRVLREGIEIRRMIGRHSNDQMFSFYMATPSKLGLEYGHGGRLIDPDQFTAETLASFEAGDVWGHQPPFALEHPIGGVEPAG